VPHGLDDCGGALVIEAALGDQLFDELDDEAIRLRAAQDRDDRLAPAEPVRVSVYFPEKRCGIIPVSPRMHIAPGAGPRRRRGSPAHHARVSSIRVGAFGRRGVPLVLENGAETIPLVLDNGAETIPFVLDNGAETISSMYARRHDSG
jgi:hypothetical protein